MLALSTTRRVIVTYPNGICARASLAIIKVVRRFQAKVRIDYGGQDADASEILPIMTLGVPRGAEVVLEAEGPDDEEVLDALVKLFADDFGMSGR
jgi:phosphotransferase system HPr (HPr) family protein